MRLKSGFTELRWRVSIIKDFLDRRDHSLQDESRDRSWIWQLCHQSYDNLPQDWHTWPNVLGRENTLKNNRKIIPRWKVLRCNEYQRCWRIKKFAGVSCSESSVGFLSLDLAHFYSICGRPWMLMRNILIKLMTYATWKIQLKRRALYSRYTVFLFLFPQPTNSSLFLHGIWTSFAIGREQDCGN